LITHKYAEHLGPIWKYDQPVALAVS